LSDDGKSSLDQGSIITSSLGRSPTARTKARILRRVLYKFEAVLEDEVDLMAEGDMVDVLEGSGREGWTFVEVDSGRRGYVPTNYIT
jgi:hypothetical protein